MFLALSKNGYFQSFLGRFAANISARAYHTENREQRSKTQNRDAANIRYLYIFIMRQMLCFK